MVHPDVIAKQLRAIGADQSAWGKAERDELPRIMMKNEVIEHVQRGYYSGGFASLIATNQRLLLVDKKPFFLSVIDLRYDMIAEVDYGHQLFGATIHVQSFNKDFKFQCLNKTALRDLTSFIQQRVMQVRGQESANTAARGGITKQAIPMQTFTSDGNVGDLTDAQTNGLLPLGHDAWYRANPARRAANPYTQSPFTTRRRIGRFSFADRQN